VFFFFIFSKHMNSDQWIDRYKRASEQRMYLIESSKNGSEFQFFVMGNTDKQYKITIGKKISCTCPDCFHSHKFCKHLMLLTIRMLGLPEERVKTDLFTVSDRCIDACMNYFQRKLQAETIVPEESGNRKPLDDELGCPICCEEFVKTNEPIVFCQQGCGNNVHFYCFSEWCQVSNIKTCVVCRSPWTKEEKMKLERKDENRYINLAEYQIGFK